MALWLPAADPPFGDLVGGTGMVTKAVGGQALGPATSLGALDGLVVRMFALVSHQLTAATEAFLTGDRQVARSVVAGDREVDEHLGIVEHQVERRLTECGPVAPDEAHHLVAIIRIAPELERSGDLIEHIALRTPQRLADVLSPRGRALLSEMGALASQLWRIAADAYVDRDPARIDDMRRLDDLLDDLHVDFTTELTCLEPSIAEAIELGLVARFYERLGDHAVNIVRRIPRADDAS